ncbi:hypothetical protein EDB92DRAFT_1001029 [Lactarius akahatsu]|uniref:Uncharacterized protein n=1 Tax=Lactarius akahatsu TaxID=416441 RepID=A0AAD4LD00_9AGAM|nr:hypothetical protein EDB92DRAFT_1001029 [Lactarius akahatsu]
MLSHHSLIHPLHHLLAPVPIESAFQLHDCLPSRHPLSQFIYGQKTYLTTVLQTIRRALTKQTTILIHPRQIPSFHSLRRVLEEVSRTGDAIPHHQSPHPLGTPTWTPCLPAASTRLKCPMRSSSLPSARTPRFLQSSPSTPLSLTASLEARARDLTSRIRVNSKVHANWMDDLAAISEHITADSHSPPDALGLSLAHEDPISRSPPSRPFPPAAARTSPPESLFFRFAPD